MPDQLALDRAAISDGLDADFWSLRFVDETCESFSVRRNVQQPWAVSTDRGVMASVYAGGGYGYAATADTSLQGLRTALQRAQAWARGTARLALTDSRTLPRPAPRGCYVSPAFDAPLPTHGDWYEMLQRESRDAACDPRIVDWEALVDVLQATHRLVTSEGGDVVQRHRYLYPSISVTAHAEGVTQQRSLNGQRGMCQQGGIEILDRVGFAGSGRRVAEEALELLLAPNCPSGRMDVLLAPDQMVLQIHESIGHPLELDRILGDERNFAGTSFVTPDMNCVRPLSKSDIAAGIPAYGIIAIRIPAALANISVERCVTDPTDVPAYDSSPGRAFAYATNSFSDFTDTLVGTTRTNDAVPRLATGVKSRSGS